MNTFLERIAQHLLDKPESMDRYAVVVPSRRAIVYLRQAMAQNLESPVFLPRFYTMGDLAQTITGLSPADLMTVGLELYATYKELYADAEEFEVFDAWSSAILKDFNTIDTYLIAADKLYTDLRLLKEINEWSFLGEELGVDQEDFNHFWQRLGPLYQRFNERLEGEGKAYSGAIMRVASESIRSIELMPEVKGFIFLGFNALSEAEVQLMHGLHEQERLEVFWDDAPFFSDNTDDPAGYFMRRWKEQPWKQQFSSENRPPQSVQISSHPHAISQVMWAASLLDSMPAHEQVALILADEGMLPALLDQFPASLQHVNITIGLGFKDTAIFHLIKQFMLAHIQAERGVLQGQNWQVHHSILSEWVEAATRVDLIGQNAVKRLHEMVQKKRVLFFTPSQLAEVMGSDEVQRYGWMDQAIPQLIESIGHQLHDLQASDRLQSGVAERMAELISDAGAAISVYPFIRRAEQLWRAIQSALARERLSFVGEPLRGLQVMGLLETRALQFDTVILLGANEGKLPKSRSYDTFLPFDIRRHYGLPAQYEEDAIFAYYFNRLLQGTREVYIGYTSERDEFGGGEKSRYISQLESGLPQQYGLDVEIDSQLFSPRGAALPAVEERVKSNAEIQVLILEFFQKGVSFSRLSVFNRCPLDFYYKSILGLGEEEEVEEEIGSSELGTVVHEVLEESFKPKLNSSVVQPADIVGMQEKMAQRLEESMQKHALDHLSASGESALVKAMAREMLQNFFIREQKRIAGGAMHILGLEQKIALEREVVLGGVPRIVRFKAVIDRVEQVEGKRILIDYKTGKVDAASLQLKTLEEEQLFDPKNGKALQLLYYLWLYHQTEGEVAEAAIISMLGMDEEVKSLGIKDRPQIDEEALGEFEAMLFALLDRIYCTEEFQHDQELGKYCSYCVEVVEEGW